MRRVRLLVLATVLVGAGGCSGAQVSADGSDGAAVAACREALAPFSASERLATTVRAEGPGYAVSAWRSGRAEGEPDHLCQVARDADAPRGVAVVRLQTRDGAGGHRSTLDVELDPQER